MRIFLLFLLLLSISATLFADCHSDAREIGSYYQIRCLPAHRYYQLCQFGDIGNATITGSNGKCTASNVDAVQTKGGEIYNRTQCTFYWDKGNWGDTILAQC